MIWILTTNPILFRLPNDELLYSCSSLRANNTSPRSFVIFFFFQNDVLVFTRETWLKRVCSSLRANNEFHRSIIFLSLHTQVTLTSIAFLPWPFLTPKMTELREPLQSNSSLVLTFAVTLVFTWIFLCSFRHPFRKWLMLNKHKRWFHSSRVNLPLVSMSASWFLVSMYLIWILGSKLILPHDQSRATLYPGNMSHCGTSSLYNHLDHCFVVFKHIQQSFLLRILDVWGNTINVIQHVGWFLSRQTTGFSGLSGVWVVFPRTETIRSQIQRAGIPSNLNPASEERWFQLPLNCVKLRFVSYTSNLLEQNVWLPKNAQCSSRSGFWILKISRKIGVKK